MGRRSRGVLTRKGVLTFHLQDLDLTRKALAEAVGVSTRTIHNIEHGKKRVEPAVLGRLAAVLNARSREILPAAEALCLSADHFTDAHDATIGVFLQSVILNRPDMLFAGDDPVASPRLRWFTPGNPQRIAFAGDYSGFEVGQLMDGIHEAFQLEGIGGVRMLKDRTNSTLTLRAILKTRHPESQAVLAFIGYAEIDIKDRKLRLIDSVYDTGLLSEFLCHGVVPTRHQT